MAPARFALLVVALAAFATLAPLAQADHVFSHRTYVVGRVVDSEGAPAAGVPVVVQFANLTTGGRCFDSREEVTGPQGDYRICRHTHALPSNVSVTVTAGNASGRARVDPDLRHAVVNLQLSGPAGGRDIGGTRLFERTYRVEGRVFTLLKEPVNVEGVEVGATPRGGLNVSARLESASAVLAERNATVDEMGAYSVDLDVADVPEDAIVRVVAGGIESTQEASALHRRSDVHVLRDMRQEVSLSEVPGSSPTPAPGLALLLAVAALAAGAQRRRRAR